MDEITYTEPPGFPITLTVHGEEDAYDAIVHILEDAAQSCREVLIAENIWAEIDVFGESIRTRF